MPFREKQTEQKSASKGKENQHKHKPGSGEKAQPGPREVTGSTKPETTSSIQAQAALLSDKRLLPMERQKLAIQLRRAGNGHFLRVMEEIHQDPQPSTIQRQKDEAGIEGQIINAVNAANVEEVVRILNTANKSEKQTIFDKFFDKVTVDLAKAAPDAYRQALLKNHALLEWFREELDYLRFLTFLKTMVDVSNLPAGLIQDAVVELAFDSQEYRRIMVGHILSGEIKTGYIKNLRQPDSKEIETLLKDVGLNPSLYTVYINPVDNKPFPLPKNPKGFSLSGCIYIRDDTPLQSTTSYASGVIVHELSHALYGDKEIVTLYPLREKDIEILYRRDGLPTRTLSEYLYNSYKEEFRAYWLGEFFYIKNLNERAQKIKEFLLGSSAYPFSSFYKKSKDSMNTNSSSKKEFREYWLGMGESSLVKDSNEQTQKIGEFLLGSSAYPFSSKSKDSMESPSSLGDKGKFFNFVENYKRPDLPDEIRGANDELKGE